MKVSLIVLLAIGLAGCTGAPVLPEAGGLPPVRAGSPFPLPPAAPAGGASAVRQEAKPATLSGPVRSAAVPAEPLPVDDRVYDSVYFVAGSAQMQEDGKRLLREAARKLTANRRLDATLVGHTDDLGSTELNIALAQRRVEIVAAELIARGVGPRQLRRISYGNEAARESCDTPACRQGQRRVEIRYSE